MERERKEEIQRIDYLTREILARYVCESKPFIVNNAISTWNAKNWDSEYLIQMVCYESLFITSMLFCVHFFACVWCLNTRE
jgi:hypothetical protein